MNATTLTLYTDGSCLGNPGPGGYAAILVAGSERREFSRGFAGTTNNRMELRAVIVGLAAVEPGGAVTVVTDSQYVKKAFTDGWLAGWKRNGWKTAAKKPVKNQDLWKRLDALIGERVVSWRWVRGHAGHPENERCDALARAAAAGRGLERDVPA